MIIMLRRHFCKYSYVIHLGYYKEKKRGFGKRGQPQHCTEKKTKREKKKKNKRRNRESLQ